MRQCHHIANMLTSLFLIISYLATIEGEATDGLEYLDPGPNYLRVCCNIVDVSASELVYDAASNSTSTVPVFANTPVAALTLSKFKLSKDTTTSVTGHTVALGQDSGLRAERLYLVCFTTATSAMRRCVTFRPCDCATCGSTLPWLRFDVSNVAPVDRSFIQLYTEPVPVAGPPPCPVSVRLRLWDGITYRMCRPRGTLVDAGPRCQPLEILPDMERPMSHFRVTTIWPSGDNSSANFSDSFSFQDGHSLSTVTAEFNVTVHLSMIGTAYEDVVIGGPAISWNRNGYSQYSKNIPYATPTFINNYAATFDGQEDALSTCQKVISRKAADQVNAQSGAGNGTTGRNSTQPPGSTANRPPPIANGTTGSNQTVTINSTSENGTLPPVSTANRPTPAAITNGATGSNQTVAANSTSGNGTLSPVSNGPPTAGTRPPPAAMGNGTASYNQTAPANSTGRPPQPAGPGNPGTAGPAPIANETTVSSIVNNSAINQSNSSSLSAASAVRQASENASLQTPSGAAQSGPVNGTAVPPSSRPSNGSSLNDPAATPARGTPAGAAPTTAAPKNGAKIANSNSICVACFVFMITVAGGWRASYGE